MKTVSIIIPNKNTSELLRVGLRNLEEVRQNYYEHLEVIVVDTGSTDGSLDMLKNEYPWVQVLHSDTDGLSAVSNLGAEHATGDYLLFLGPDAYPRPRTIGGMVEYMETSPKVGLATPKLYLQQGSLDPDAHRSFPTPWNSFTRLTGLYKLFPKSRLFNSYFMWYEDLNKPHEIDACVYGFMLFSRKAFDDVGGFDPDYFMHGEDLDICYRLKQKGYKIMYLPQWESGHFKTRISGKDTAPKVSLSESVAYAQSSTRAMRTFLKKHYKQRYPAPLVWFMLLGTYGLELQRIARMTIRHLFS